MHCARQTPGGEPGRVMEMVYRSGVFNFIRYNVRTWELHSMYNLIRELAIHQF